MSLRPTEPTEAPETVRLAVPAKVNLALHILGRRADSYHDLQSLVAFAEVDDGDTIAVSFGQPGPDGPRLTVSGRFADLVPHGADNLVLRAARLCPEVAAVHLVKGLPVAAGIGGGSADAAAVLRASAARRGLPAGEMSELGLSLGADVPVCLEGRPAIMAGIGDVLTPVALPSVPGILVNPGLPLATADVFRALTRRDNPGFTLPPLADADALCDALTALRNDMESTARALLPQIGDVLTALEHCEGVRIARMSGSGPTVFALFTENCTRDRAVAQLRSTAPPSWWIRPVRFAGSSDH